MSEGRSGRQCEASPDGLSVAMAVLAPSLGQSVDEEEPRPPGVFGSGCWRQAGCGLSSVTPQAVSWLVTNARLAETDRGVHGRRSSARWHLVGLLFGFGCVIPKVGGGMFRTGHDAWSGMLWQSHNVSGRSSTPTSSTELRS